MAKYLIDTNDIKPIDGYYYTDATHRAAIRSGVIPYNAIFDHAIPVKASFIPLEKLKAYLEDEMSKAHEADIRSRQSYIAHIMADVEEMAK